MVRFVFPLPLKLRDMQAMVRPFMEVRSVHHINGLDAMVGELTRGLLRLFHTVRAWEEALGAHATRLLEAEASGQAATRNAALLDLCATMELDVFEASHRLHRVDANIFRLTPGEIEVLCQKLPLFIDRRVLRGPPTSALDHGLHGASLRITPQGLSPRATRGPLGDDGEEEPTTLEVIRLEGASWWHDQRFVNGAPALILAGALLTHLVDLGLHPDPYVAEMLPRVLDRLFGPQVSRKAWLNRLLPTMGGYVDSRGQQVAPGEGLPLHSNPERCAETLLVFLRRWCDLVLGAEEEDAARDAKRELKSDSTLRRGSQFLIEHFVSKLMETGHSTKEVVDLLEGATEVPRHVLEVSDDGRRYRVDDNMVRSWELLTAQYLDGIDALEDRQRDLGPYIQVDLDRPEEMAKYLQVDTKGAWHIVNPEVAKAAARYYQLDDDEEQDVQDQATLTMQYDASDVLGLKLVEWPAELNPEGNTGSTFIRFFSQEGKRISRFFMQGLPPLPWSFGSDERNTIIMDIEHRYGVAAFHCIFARARAQPKRPVIVPLGDPMSPSYVVCPKYQPLQVRNGDRLICHQWTFELRLEPKGPHLDQLQILTDEGTVFEVPFEGCHMGAGSRSMRVDYQPYFPPTKFVLTHRLMNMAAVHVVFQYTAGLNRWMLMDHSPDALGTLLLLKPGVAYPLSAGLQLKLGPLILQVVSEMQG